MSTPSRYFHTVRYLRPVQILARLWRKLPRPALDRSPAPARREARAAWSGPTLRPRSIVGERRVAFLGDERELTDADAWRTAHPAALWMYNLHYFDDLNAPGDDVQERRRGALLDRWIAENPPGLGVAWDAYPISVRSFNWVRWILRGNAPRPGMLDSLALQARHLAANLEHHLLGNHLLVNAKALVTLGTFFAGAEADAWFAVGQRLLERELDEQILRDGGHFERSPMYHALMLEDVLDLIALEQVFARTVRGGTRSLRALAARMLDWLRAMTHPDGDLALLNDATTGVAPTTAQLVAYAAGLGVASSTPRDRSVDLPDTGYTRVEHGDAVVMIDTAPVGPDYQPGHAHADTLTFELSLRGRRLIVDSGVSEYGTSRERQRQRSTAAHNTVEVDGADSSEVWGGFRVARRARIVERRVSLTGERSTVAATHLGYTRLPGRVRHHRTWSVTDHDVVVEDRVTGDRRHRVVARFHLAPDVQPERRGDHAWSLGDAASIHLDPGFTWTAVPTTIHPAMGVHLPSYALVGSFEGMLPVTCRVRIEWT